MSEVECVQFDGIEEHVPKLEPNLEVDNSSKDGQNKYWQNDEKESTKSDSRFVTWKSVVMYGLCVSLAFHYTSWTTNLNAGFWEVFGTMFIICSATTCMMFCVAEMTAALPFSGGTYGVVRVTLGDLLGYLVGTCEVLQNVLYVTFSVATLAKYVTVMTGYDEKYEPLSWLIFYITIGIITANHKMLFWRSLWVFGIFVAVMLLLFCTMTRDDDVDFAKYTKDPEVANLSQDESVYRFFENLPTASFFFNLSIKVLPLACRESKNPTTDVPKAMYIVFALAIVSAFSLLFCISSIAPEVKVLKKFPAAPLSFGFSSMFDIPIEHSIAFTLLAKYSTCLVFTFAFTQQMAALSKSGFLWNSRKWGFVPDRYDNVVSLLVGCGFGYLLNVLIFYWSEDIRLYVVNGFKILGYSLNMVIFVTYITFRRKFPSLMKKFRSPLGVPGAVYGLTIYIIVWSCIGALNDMGNHWAPFVLLACFLVIWSLPFFLYYRYHLTFSEEESTVLFIAYVIKANQTRRMQKHRHISPVGSHAGSSASTPQHSKSKPTDKRRWHTSFRRTGSTSTREANTESELSLSVVRVEDGEGRKEDDEGDGPTMRGATILENSVLEFEPIQTAEHSKVALYAVKEESHDIPVTIMPTVRADSTSPKPSFVDRISVTPTTAPASMEHQTTAPTLIPNHIVLPPINTGHNSPRERRNRVAPMLQPVPETQDCRNRRAAAMDNVLANELGYEEDMVGHLRTEIQEYYGATHLSSAAASDGDDENV